MRSGKLKKEKCFCGKAGQPHHEDYSKPLDVIWLCPKHHTARHGQLRATNLKTTGNEFADSLRVWRKCQGISRAELARRLGVPYRTLEDWEAGRRKPRGLSRRMVQHQLALLSQLALKT